MTRVQIGLCSLIAQSPWTVATPACHSRKVAQVHSDTTYCMSQTFDPLSQKHNYSHQS